MKGVPEKIKKSMGKFFMRAKNISGNKVAASVEGSRNRIKLDSVRSAASSLRKKYVPRGMSFEDLDIPKGQAVRLEQWTKKIKDYGSIVISSSNRI